MADAAATLKGPQGTSSSSRNFLLKESTAEVVAPEEEPVEGDPGKVFVGNLPYHVKREAVKDFFAQCGPVRDIIFIRSHDNPAKNKGYCFLFFGGPDPIRAASKAAEELDGANFFGKALTVRIDDGRWERDRREQRERWIESGAVRPFFHSYCPSPLHSKQFQGLGI